MLHLLHLFSNNTPIIMIVAMQSSLIATFTKNKVCIFKKRCNRCNTPEETA